MAANNNRKTALIIALAACLLGLGAATFAGNALASAAPDDAKAATTGPASAMQPSDVLGYGG